MYPSVMAPQRSISSVLVHFGCVFLVFAAFSSASFDGELSDPSLFSIGSGLACEFAKCLRGHCVNASSFPFFKCECNAGWRSAFGASWLPCVLPNCSIDLTCANSSSAIPAPPPVAPSFNRAFDICSLSVCGNGVCIQNTSSASNSTDDYECKCDTGYVNLRNETDGFCIRECSIGADCTNVQLPIGGATHAPPPPASSSSSSSASSASPPNSSQGQLNRLQKRLVIAASVVLAMMWA